MAAPPRSSARVSYRRSTSAGAASTWPSWQPRDVDPLQRPAFAVPSCRAWSEGRQLHTSSRSLRAGRFPIPRKLTTQDRAGEVHAPERAGDAEAHASALRATHDPLPSPQGAKLHRTDRLLPRPDRSCATYMLRRRACPQPAGGSIRPRCCGSAPAALAGKRASFRECSGESIQPDREKGTWPWPLNALCPSSSRTRRHAT